MDKKKFIFLVTLACATAFTLVLTIWSAFIWQHLNADIVQVNNLIVKNDIFTSDVQRELNNQ